jgi:hypothetical protein
MFAYCSNNPVNNCDFNGKIAISLSVIIFGTVVGIIFGGGAEFATQLYENDGEIEKVDWGSVANSAIVGGALGFSSSMGLSYLGPMIANGTITAGTLLTSFSVSVGVSAVAGGGGYLLQETFNGRKNNINVKGVLINTCFVALEGAYCFGVSGMVGSIGTIGEKGAFMTKEWIWKNVLGQEFSKPFKYLIDKLKEVIWRE